MCCGQDVVRLTGQSSSELLFEVEARTNVQKQNRKLAGLKFAVTDCGYPVRIDRRSVGKPGFVKIPAVFGQQVREILSGRTRLNQLLRFDGIEPQLRNRGC